MVNLVPPSGGESTSMRPPCSPTICWTRASPSPVPFALVEKNGSKMHGVQLASDKNSLADAWCRRWSFRSSCHPPIRNTVFSSTAAPEWFAVLRRLTKYQSWPNQRSSIHNPLRRRGERQSTPQHQWCRRWNRTVCHCDIQCDRNQRELHDYRRHVHRNQHGRRDIAHDGVPSAREVGFLARSGDCQGEGVAAAPEAVKAFRASPLRTSSSSFSASLSAHASRLMKLMPWSLGRRVLGVDDDCWTHLRWFPPL